MSRVRSAGDKVGSDSNPLRTIFFVIASIIFAWAQLAPLAGVIVRRIFEGK